MHKAVFIFTLLLTFHFSYAQDCVSYGMAQIDLDANNVRARLLNSGDFWWDGDDAKYIAPIVDPGFAEVAAIFSGAIWIAGTDPLGIPRVAAQKFRGNGETDFYPGPLVSENDAPTFEDCQDWDRFWKVNRSEVESHIADYNDNNVIDNPIASIFGWPGKNNPVFTSYFDFELPADHDLAPFFDRDNDGIYNPENGDYPMIKGDQSIWWVFNDLAGLHRASFGSPLGVEIQAMAYAEASSDIDINNATYYDFKITNKSNVPLFNSYMGLWADFDLGCARDDYVGYNIEHQMMYAYNEDAQDGDFGTTCSNGTNTYKENIPIIGITQVGNPGFPVTSCIGYDSGDSSLPPETFTGFYNFLQGRWRDGTPVTFGGKGYNPMSTDTVLYTFPGDPADELSWSMCTANLPSADRRAVMSTALNTLQPGQSFTNTYAVVFVENENYPCPSLDRLIEASEVVSNNVLTSTYDIKDEFGLSVFPNPATNVLRVKSEKIIHKIQLLSMNGEVLLSQKNNYSFSERTLNLETIRNGMYFVSVKDAFGNSVTKKVIIQR